MVLFYTLNLISPIVLDDWLRRERFVFEGLNPFLFLGTAFAFWFIGAIFVSSWLFFEFLCLEGCNALIAAISTPPNSLGYFILSWRPEAEGFFTFHMVVGLMLILLGLAVLLYAIHGATVENTLVEDGDEANTFCAFNSTQAEETYSMVTANRFWSQIFGLAFFAITITVLGSLSIMFSYHMWISGADELLNQIYALDSCMAGEQAINAVDTTERIRLVYEIPDFVTDSSS